MTGHEVTRIRKALGLTLFQFSGLILVHWTTVARWQAFERRHIKAEGMNREILGWLEELASMPGADQAAARISELAAENHLRAMLHLTATVQSIRFQGFIPEQVSVHTRGKVEALVKASAEVLR